MYTWIFILVVNLFLVAGLGIIMMKSSQYRSMKPLVFILITALILGGLWLGAQDYLAERTIQSAEPVMQWEQCPATDRNIYYDAENGTYFFVTYDDWKAFPLFHRNYLDPVKTAEFVELNEQMEQYNIRNMLLKK